MIGGYGGGLEDAGVIFDRVPKGEVEVRRSSPVTAADDHFLGEVDGFVVDGGHITHFVLERGHLWGKREITIPIGAVAKVENDAVSLSLSKDEVDDLRLSTYIAGPSRSGRSVRYGDGAFRAHRPR